MGRPKGFKLSEETKRRIGLGNAGKPKTPMTSTTKLKLSRAMVRKYKTETHPMCGRKLSAEIRLRLSLAKRGKRSYQWIPGVPQRYATLHSRIKTLYGKADHCENPQCPGKNKQFHWSNKKHDYKSLDKADWQQLCNPCHQLYDAEHIRGKGR